MNVPLVAALAMVVELACMIFILLYSVLLSCRHGILLWKMMKAKIALKCLTRLAFLGTSNGSLLTVSGGSCQSSLGIFQITFDR